MVLEEEVLQPKDTSVDPTGQGRLGLVSGLLMTLMK